jgi:hypothetical protein
VTERCKIAGVDWFGTFPIPCRDWMHSPSLRAFQIAAGRHHLRAHAEMMRQQSELRAACALSGIDADAVIRADREERERTTFNQSEA